MAGGYMGKLLFVDLTKKSIEERPLPEKLARDFIGGYGIGARVLYDMMKPGADPLGPENVVGFVTSPLNGTGALYGGRYMVVCKSPVTGGWNDANSGGFFGPELKKAGFDAVFVSGASAKPVYLFIKDGKAELRDALKLWGKGCTATEEALFQETGEKKLRAAIIGPAGERRSLMAAIINDGHRAAARGGCGAVMGSKNLKAVVVRGTKSVSVADPARLKEVNAGILDYMKNGPTAELLKAFGTYGTGVTVEGSGLCGDTPIKNWGGAGGVDMSEEEFTRISTFSLDEKYKMKKYACANCPLGCGAHYNVVDGTWPVGETGRPEYETLAAFGGMTLNSNAESIIKCNDICNRYGLDTISVGATIAWAIECYENGIFTKDETNGILLTWGNASSIVAITQAIADQMGFGAALALGSEHAAARLGKGSEYLQTVRGMELGMHDPRFSPGFGRTYQHDPTPGRHIKGGLGLGESAAPAEVRYDYASKGHADMAAACHSEIISTSGLCIFGGAFAMTPDVPAKLISAVTGWDFTEGDVLTTGKRIMNMRWAFNLREGQKPDATLPSRSVGEPPLAAGPVKGVTVDHRTMGAVFWEHMGWDKENLMPTRQSLEEQGGMDDVIRSLYG
jgi:aldehyde:ferredoxin oxidoreductase